MSLVQTLDSERKRFRQIMSHFATGVTLLTTTRAGRPQGMTANAVCSVSLDPLLLLVCVHKEAATHNAIHETGAYCVNILGSAQEEVARRFAGDHRKMAEPFADLTWHRGKTGVPVLKDAIAHIECDLHATCDGGDHTIFVGRVVGMEGLEAEQAVKPLIFYGGAFRTLE